MAADGTTAPSLTAADKATLLLRLHEMVTEVGDWWMGAADRPLPQKVEHMVAGANVIVTLTVGIEIEKDRQS